MDEQPQSQCPKCRGWQDDYDGFGVLHCEACGYCAHPSASGDDAGNMVCDICNATIKRAATCERLHATIVNGLACG